MIRQKEGERMPHTKGPWRLGQFGAIHGGPLVEYFNGSAQPQIALAILHEQITPEEWDANARLIVAAPEFLEAAKFFAKAMNHGAKSRALDDSLNMFQAAIAKAEGG
jgi:hypothetical protein